MVDTSALLSPAFASLPDANASSSWLDGGADAALVASCCGGQRLVIPVRLSAPGYAPEVATAAFNASVLQTWSNMSGKMAGGVVAGLFQERPGGGGSLEDLMLGGGVPADQANAASAPPELITRVPARAALANATLFIDTTFAGPKWARQRTAASGGGQAEAGGTKAASVDLSGTGVNTAASTCSNPANPDCPNYDPKLDPACQALSPPPPARCNRTVNSAAGAREGATTQQTGIISGAGSAYSGGGTGGYGYGYGGYGYGGCAAHSAHLQPLSGDAPARWHGVATTSVAAAMGDGPVLAAFCERTGRPCACVPRNVIQCQLSNVVFLGWEAHTLWSFRLLVAVTCPPPCAGLSHDALHMHIGATRATGCIGRWSRVKRFKPGAAFNAPVQSLRRYYGSTYYACPCCYSGYQATGCTGSGSGSPPAVSTPSSTGAAPCPRPRAAAAAALPQRHYLLPACSVR